MSYPFLVGGCTATFALFRAYAHQIIAATCSRRRMRAGVLLFVRAMHLTLTASLPLLAFVVRPLGASLPMLWLLAAATVLMLLAYSEGTMRFRSMLPTWAARAARSCSMLPDSAPHAARLGSMLRATTADVMKALRIQALESAAARAMLRAQLAGMHISSTPESAALCGVALEAVQLMPGLGQEARACMAQQENMRFVIGAFDFYGEHEYGEPAWASRDLLLDLPTPGDAVLAKLSEPPKMTKGSKKAAPNPVRLTAAELAALPAFVKPELSWSNLWVASAEEAAEAVVRLPAALTRDPVPDDVQPKPAKAALTLKSMFKGRR